MSNTNSFDAQSQTEIAIRFLRQLRRTGPWTLAAIAPEGGTPIVQTFHGDSEVRLMREWIKKRNGKTNLYLIPNRTKQRMSRKPAEGDMAFFDFAHVDCDPLDNEAAADARERHRAVLKSGIVPAPTF